MAWDKDKQFCFDQLWLNELAGQNAEIESAEAASLVPAFDHVQVQRL